MICLLSSRTRREVRSHPRFGWTGGGLTRCSVGRGRCGAAGPGLGSWGRGASEGGKPGGRACPGTLRRDAAPNFTFVLAQAGGGGAVPERLRPGARGVNPKALQSRGLDSTCHREADVERDRERKQARDQSPGKVLPRLGQL